MALHDICDEWRIILLDQKLNLLSEKAVLDYKPKLEQKIKEIAFKDDDVRFSDGFSLEIDDNILEGEQYSFPEGAPLDEAVKKLQDTCFKFAKEEGINVMLKVFITGTENGIDVNRWNHAASIFGKTSTSDAFVYEHYDDEEDDYLLYQTTDFSRPIEREDIEEHLIDELRDNFDEKPWECDEDGELTEKGEFQEGKFCVTHTKYFFPDLYDRDLDDEFFNNEEEDSVEPMAEPAGKCSDLKKTGLDPLVGEEPKILILGTMPGNKSLETGEYYASHTNSFWKFMEQIYNKGKQFLNYDEKVECLKANKVAVWDLAHQCDREGSADKNMKNVVYNDLAGFLNEHPTIELLVFNGKKTSKDFEEHIKIEKKCATAPSTSNAYPMSFEKKLEGWKEALGFKK